MKVKKIRWFKVIFGVGVYLAFISFGFIIGMIYQQQLFAQELGKVLSYTDIHIDFNATKFAEELNRTFVPALKEAFNQTLKEKNDN